MIDPATVKAEESPSDQLAVSTPGRAGRKKRTIAVTIAVIFLVALAVRMVNLGGKSFWVDEGATAEIASTELDQILTGDLDLEHPPGYYVLIHGVAQISDSETAIRLPSALASAGVAVVIYLLAAKLWSRRIGLVAAGLAVLSPLDIWYAQEARHPALAGLAIALGYLALSRSTIPGAIAAGLALIAGLYLDFIVAFGWLVAGAVWIVLYWWRDRSYVRQWFLVTIVASLVYAPIQGAEMMSGFEGLLDFSGAGVWYGDVLGSNPLTSNAIGAMLFVFAMTVIGAIVHRSMIEHPRWQRTWAWLVVAGYSLIVAATPVPRAYSLKKIVVVVWPLVLIAVAYVIMRTVSESRRSTVIWGMTALSVAAVIVTLLVPKDDWRSAVGFINSNAVEGDVAWVSSEPWADDAYQYYDGALPVSRSPDPSDEIAPGQEVWLITKRRPQDSIPAIEAEEWFSSNWELVEEEPLYRLAVQRYRSPDAG